MVSAFVPEKGQRRPELEGRDSISVESIGANYVTCDVAFVNMTFDEAMRTTGLIGKEVIPAF